MEEKKLLINKFRELTPKVIKTDLITDKKSPDCNDYEFRRKYGLSEYWGYSYPDYRDSRAPKAHYKNCIDSLKNMEFQLKSLFSEFEIIENESIELPFESDWKEENTAFLLDDYYKEIISNVESAFEKSTLLNKLVKYQKKFTSGINDLLSVGSFLDPKVERLVKLKSPSGGRFIFSVSPDRYFRANFEKASVYVADKGTSIIGYTSLPILLQFEGFRKEDEKFKELHEKLATIDFNPLKREFPFVPTTSQINCNKFDKIIRKNAKKEKYVLDIGARFAVENALKEGTIGFNEAEKLLLGLFNGEIVFESEIINGLQRKVSKDFP
jgi:hypothetical protein